MQAPEIADSLEAVADESNVAAILLASSKPCSIGAVPNSKAKHQSSGSAKYCAGSGMVCR
jgi:hypothetical protein